MNQFPLKIGTRGSRLALWQSEFVANALDVPTELCIIKTQGDRFLEAALQTQAGKGFFTKEIEDELLNGTVDLAVHSLKDLPSELPEGLAVGAILPRAPVCDVLLIHPDFYDPAEALPVRAGGKVGASSLRRQSLLKRYAPKLVPTLLRGNVPTRLMKLRTGDYAAIVLAKAGLWRLGLDLEGLIALELTPEVWVPAPAQGAMAIEIKRGNVRAETAIAALNDPATTRAVALERRLLARFEGGCHAAFGAFVAPIDEERIVVYLGHEDKNGSWLATACESSWDEAEGRAYHALSRILSGESPERALEGELCRPYRPSF